MRIGIVAKPDDPRRVKICGMVAEAIRGKAEVVAIPEVAKHYPDLPGVPIEEMVVDVIVTVGGDGTILYTMQKNPAPVFGINVGELGFLTEIDPIELNDGLSRLLAREFFIESRMKLAARLGSDRLPDAANEVVVKTAKVSKILRLKVAWGEGAGSEALADHWAGFDVRADGLIVSTPTGSSSYAMSAGGPIVDPRLDAIGVVPLAPFSLSSRPIVLPSHVEVSVRCLEPNKVPVVVIDGQFEREIRPDEVLRVTASRERARFVRFRNQFYARLRERLA